jgi:hypothetical protein
MDSPLQSLKHDNKIYSLKWNPAPAQRVPVLARCVHATTQLRCCFPTEACLTVSMGFNECTVPPAFQRILRSHNKDLERSGGHLSLHSGGSHESGLLR